ncbi:DUF4270 domain-containing protein [Lacinutrix undariae]
MKKRKIALRNVTILCLIVTSFIACDKDFASIDSDIVNNSNATHYNTDSEKFDVIAYSKKLGPVQTNNLPVNMFGAYNDPFYGLTTASFASQLNASLLDPDFGTIVSLDSVVLTIPYFSTSLGTDADGIPAYELDSIYGNGFINFSIYESNYFLRDFDPSSDFDESQSYYSNTSASETETINPSFLEGTLLYNSSDVGLFKPSSDPIRLDIDGEFDEFIAPALRLKLDTDFWQEKILDREGEPELSNQNNFNDYFRGLYFKAESTTSGGTLSLLNLASSSANITIYYTKESITEDVDDVQSTFSFSFGNTANFLSNNFNVTLADGDPVNGDEKLYLKGGEGSMAVINLFNGDEDGNSTELEDFRTNNWLINEANLVFYVDQDLVNSEEPNRIYLYDLENKTPLADYYLDASNSTTEAFSRTSHLGPLQHVDDDPEEQGIKYKIRITDHINNILLNDSTNVKLGLVVSGNTNLESTLLQYKIQSDDELVNEIPGSSIISPRGTVLYGNNTTNEDKKLQLEIFYTEEQNN